MRGKGQKTRHPEPTAWRNLIRLLGGSGVESLTLWSYVRGDAKLRAALYRAKHATEGGRRRAAQALLEPHGLVTPAKLVAIIEAAVVDKRLTREVANTLQESLLQRVNAGGEWR